MDSGELDFYQHDKVCSNTCRSTKIDLSGARVSLSSPTSAEYLPLTPATADGTCHAHRAASALPGGPGGQRLDAPCRSGPLAREGGLSGCVPGRGDPGARSETTFSVKHGRSHGEHGGVDPNATPTASSDWQGPAPSPPTRPAPWRSPVEPAPPAAPARPACPCRVGSDRQARDALPC